MKNPFKRNRAVTPDVEEEEQEEVPAKKAPVKRPVSSGIGYQSTDEVKASSVEFPIWWFLAIFVAIVAGAVAFVMNLKSHASIAYVTPVSVISVS